MAQTQKNSWRKRKTLSTRRSRSSSKSLTPTMAGFLDELIKRTIMFCEELAGFEMFPYQRSLSYRIIESLILADAEEVTGLMARQSGKSEVVATTLSGCMVLFPKLAKTLSDPGEVQAGPVDRHLCPGR